MQGRSGKGSRALRADATAIAVMICVIFFAVGIRWYYDNWLANMDTLTAFVPWFGALGDRLRDFDIPAWSPYEASGAPIIGNPSSGWLYLPVMIVFPLFETIKAFKLLILVQTLIAGLSMYIFVRLLDFEPGPALISGTVSAIGSSLLASTSWFTIIGQSLVFIPLALLGIELAMRSTTWSGRLASAALTALALSQVLAAWPSQGILYAAMYAVGWAAYRWLIAPARPHESFRQRTIHLFAFGSAMIVFFLGFSASLVLPMLNFTGQSNVAGGDYSNVIGGDYASFSLPLLTILDKYLDPRLIEAEGQGGAIVLLCCVSLFLMGRRKYCIPFFVAAAVIFTDLAATESVTRNLFGLIPGFEQIHGHRPNGSRWFIAPAVAVLAGGGLQALLHEYRAKGSAALLKVILPLAAVLWLIRYVRDAGNVIQPQSVQVAVVAAIGLLLLTRIVPSAIRQSRAVLPAIVTLVLLASIVAYPTGKEFIHALENPTAFSEWRNPLARDPAVTEKIETHAITTAEDGSARFLQAQRNNTQPFRYAPYSGLDRAMNDTFNNVGRRLDPRVMAILTNGRASALHLEQIATYNPVHFQYYVDYYETMNGMRQDYHWLDVMRPAVSGSQLLDMLNVRYVLVPSNLQPLPSIGSDVKEVYRDDLVIIFENPNAYDRAWIVHDVQPAMNGAELELFNSGQVNGHVTAFVHGDLPPVSAPDPNGPKDSVIVTGYEPETIKLKASSTGDGLLVLSEVYADGWNAWVDGEKVDIQRTNHALRGVPLAAGEHEVVLKYEPMPLRIGLWSTALTGIAMIGVWAWAWFDGRRNRRGSARKQPPNVETALPMAQSEATGVQ
jgi:hypothetical protein